MQQYRRSSCDQNVSLLGTTEGAAIEASMSQLLLQRCCVVILQPSVLLLRVVDQSKSIYLYLYYVDFT